MDIDGDYPEDMDLESIPVLSRDDERSLVRDNSVGFAGISDPPLSYEMG